MKKDELYIVNYCHKNCEPLKNIMRLPKEQAFELARELAEQNRETTAFYRFADFENYYGERLETDAYLHAEFVRLGGAPRYSHPLSFVLQESEYLQKWFDKGIVTRLPLSMIPDEQISFTYGDSMSTWKREGELTMLTKAMLLELLENYAGTPEEFVKEINEKYGYMEVQVWGDVRVKEKIVILLNGPSSSGKSTLSETLQKFLKETKNKEYGCCSIDEFLKMTTEDEIFEDDVYEISAMIGEKALRELESKDGVIVDHVITSERIFQRSVGMLADYRMICIRVTCPIEELRRREAARGNRCPGSAEASNEYLYPPSGYEMTVDTYEMSLKECCEQILQAIER